MDWQQNWQPLERLQKQLEFVLRGKWCKQLSVNNQGSQPGFESPWGRQILRPVTRQSYGLCAFVGVVGLVRSCPPLGRRRRSRGLGAEGMIATSRGPLLAEKWRQGRGRFPKTLSEGRGKSRTSGRFDKIKRSVDSAKLLRIEVRNGLTRNVRQKNINTTNNKA